MEESSIMSATNYMRIKSLSSTTGDDKSSEVSGWSLYFADAIANDLDKELVDSYNYYPFNDSSSMASSDAAWSAMGEQYRLISKRRKTSFVDHDLEDTASSVPLHSHMVNELNFMFLKSKEMNSKDVCQAYDLSHCQIEKQEDNSTSYSQEKRHTSQQAEDIDMGFLETKLRRKGLCLVPLSMLINYVG